MKKIILSSFIIVAVSAMVIGGTMAYYSDAETSTGNTFIAGSLDLTVDHTYAMYNGEECVSSCVPGGQNLIGNGGFETPQASGWHIYSGTEILPWVIESGTGLEIQAGVAGTPYEGNQLAELASDVPSSISQIISTTPGEEYRLTFYYSPRPHRPAGENTIGFELEVVGTEDGGPIFSDIIMENAIGSSNTVWQEYEYNFKAVDSTTKITFSALGSNLSHGGYLDAVSVVSLDCDYTTYEYGGTCVLWNERNLHEGDTFWTFEDVKPGDYGKNIISLHVFDNDAYGCAFIDVEDLENTLIDPEAEDGDTTETIGELSGQISLFAWVDDGDNEWENGEQELLSGIMGNTMQFPLDYLDPQNETLIGLEWCFGTMDIDYSTNTITCDGSTVDNTSQTDILSADLSFYIEQARNNEGFDCADVVRN